jgi:hypothetical protein
VSLAFCATSAGILSDESPAHAAATARASPPSRPETLFIVLSIRNFSAVSSNFGALSNVSHADDPARAGVVDEHVFAVAPLRREPLSVLAAPDLPGVSVSRRQDPEWPGPGALKAGLPFVDGQQPRCLDHREAFRSWIADRGLGECDEVPAKASGVASPGSAA